MKPISIVGFALLWMSALASQGVSNSPQADCRHGREIEQLIRAALRENGVTEISVTDQTWCDSSAALPEHASLEIARMRWDALLHSLEFRFQCKSAGDCLPFLVRLPFPDEPMGKPNAKRGNTPQHGEMKSDFLVKPGQIATLVWEEKGLRMERRVVCLDAGRQGQQVRTRTRPGGRIVPARVIAPGLVEAGS